MQMSPFHTVDDPMHWLGRLLWQWLATGLLVLPVLSLIEIGSVYGACGFWCVVAPISALVTHYRGVFVNKGIKSKVVAQSRSPTRRARPQARRTRHVPVYETIYENRSMAARLSRISAQSA